jgi:hypothetical protein
MPSRIISVLALLTLGATFADLPCRAEPDSLGPAIMGHVFELRRERRLPLLKVNETLSRTAARAAQANLERSDSVDHTSLLKR